MKQCVTEVCTSRIKDLQSKIQHMFTHINLHAEFTMCIFWATPEDDPLDTIALTPHLHTLVTSLCFSVVPVLVSSKFQPKLLLEKV